MISFSVSDWEAYVLFGLPVEVGVTIFMVWWLNRPHNFLKQLGMKDGAQIDIRVRKAGVNVVTISMVGNDLFEAVKNGFYGLTKGIFIKPEDKTENKDNVNSNVNGNEEIINLVKKIVKDELNKE